MEVGPTEAHPGQTGSAASSSPEVVLRSISGVLTMIASIQGALMGFGLAYIAQRCT
jgi:hypothetical protein